MLCDNHYDHCGKKWTLESCDSFHDDECPECRSSITASSSTEFVNGGQITRHHASDINSGTQIFEVSLIGQSDYSNETDALVLWVEAVCSKEVMELLSPVKALLIGDIVNTGHEPSKCSYKDGLDLRVGESTEDVILNCIKRKYDFIESLDFGAIDLASELVAADISRKCASFIKSI